VQSLYLGRSSLAHWGKEYRRNRIICEKLQRGDSDCRTSPSKPVFGRAQPSSVDYSRRINPSATPAIRLEPFWRPTDSRERVL
jgi:hypothetical protein